MGRICEPVVDPGEQRQMRHIRMRSNEKVWQRVGSANDIVGYVPTPAAFDRGGYETTFLTSSKLAPPAGQLLLDSANSLAAANQAQTR